MTVFSKKFIGRVSLGILSFFILLIIGFIIFILATKPGYQKPDTRDWQTGDIFFSVGDSWKSHAVRTITSFKGTALADSTPSHCGIILMENGKPTIVHASTTAEKVVQETPEEYLKNNGAFLIYNRRPPFAIDTLQLRKDANRLVKTERPFDFDFNHKDTGSLYCTEMVIYLLERNGVYQLSDLRKQSYIYPQDVLNRLKAPKPKKGR